MKLTIALLAAVTLSSQAFALTLVEAQNELAGMNCSGSTCTSKSNGTVTTDNPDIITTTQNPDVLTSTEVLVSPAVEGSSPTITAQPVAGCWTTFIGGNGKLIPTTNVNADCVPLSLNPGKGGSPAVYGTVVTSANGGTTTTVTDGGVTVSPTCTTVSKELSWNGPNTDRANAWSVTQSSSTSDGTC